MNMLRQTLAPFTPDPVDDVVVFEGGSTVRGWANKYSDLDFYAIMPRVHEPGDGLYLTMPSGTGDGFFYRRPLDEDGNQDLQVWQDSQVEELLSVMDFDRVTDSGLNSMSLTAFEIDFLGRLWHGRPVQGHREFQRWQRRLRDSDAPTVMADRCLRHSNNAVEDAVGQLESDDIMSATLAASRAYGHAVDAVLATHGEFSASSKWRARRVAQAQPEQFTLQEYWAVETLRGYHDDPRKWIEVVLTGCQTIAASIEM